MARRRLDHVDAMRPVKQAGVISTHAILYFAPAAASAGSGAALLLLHVSREGFFFIRVHRPEPGQAASLLLAPVPLSGDPLPVLESYGVYLSHMLFIITLTWVGWGRLSSVIPWPGPDTAGSTAHRAYAGALAAAEAFPAASRPAR